MREPTPRALLRRRSVLASALAAAASSGVLHPRLAVGASREPSAELQALATLGEQDMALEEQLCTLLSQYEAPRAALSAEQHEAVARIVTLLEAGRGRQQRAGWGQSDGPWDMPFIGAWDVLYVGPRDELGGLRPREGLGRAPLPGGEQLRLVSARSWVYGPGDGGLATECVYTTPGGPHAGSMLLTRAGNVTKLPASALRFDYAEAALAYPLNYAQRSRIGSIAGSPPTLESTPQVGPLLGAEPASALRLCAASGGDKRTSYLSDVLWIVRGERGATTVLQRTEAEALRPSNGDEPDGFNPLRFGPSGRKMWMMDTGGYLQDREAGNERARARVRAQQEISAS